MLLRRLQVALRIRHAPHVQRLATRLHAGAALQLRTLVLQLPGQLPRLQALQHLRPQLIASEHAPAKHPWTPGSTCGVPSHVFDAAHI